MLNRAVLIVRYKQPFVDWVNAVDPAPTHTVALAAVNEDTTAFLIDDVEDDEDFEDWLRLHGVSLFEEVLNEWYRDPTLWPEHRTLALFRQWCTLELHSVVLDKGISPLEDDEAE